MKTSIELEWDEAKRQATLANRNVDFADVALVDWDTAMTSEDPRQEESRFVTVGMIKGRLHVMAWCWRGQKRRVISLRKANEREAKRYDEA